MKYKRVLLCCFLVALLGLIGCSQSKQTFGGGILPKTTFTAQEALDGFKAAGLQIGSSEVYTAETDPNKLMGRPGQYTGKVNFEDSRVQDDVIAGKLQNTIEVFDNNEDLQKRESYVRPIAESSPMFNQYIYSHKNMLLRLDHSLTPTQAAEYQTALNKL